MWLGERWFTVIGILDPVTLDPSLDGAALVGFSAAERLLDADRSASTISRAREPRRDRGRPRAARAHGQPGAPDEGKVSRPSDALEASAAAKTALTSLFLSLGAVALFVGGVGSPT